MNFIYEKLALDKYEICYAMAIDNTTIAAMKHWAIDLVHGRRSFIVTKRLCELFFFYRNTTIYTTYMLARTALMLLLYNNMRPS